MTETRRVDISIGRLSSNASLKAREAMDRSKQFFLQGSNLREKISSTSCEVGNLCWAAIDFCERLGSEAFSNVNSTRVVANRDHTKANITPRNQNLPYALKCVRAGSLKSMKNEFGRQSQDLAQQEATILTSLDLKNIIRVLGTNDSSNPQADKGYVFMIDRCRQGMHADWLGEKTEPSGVTGNRGGPDHLPFQRIISPPNATINSYYAAHPSKPLAAVESSIRRVSSSRQRSVSSWHTFDASAGDDADLSDLPEFDPDIVEAIITTTEAKEPLSSRTRSRHSDQQRRTRSRHSDQQPVLIPSFSWEVQTTSATLCQDAQLLILSFLDETSLRRLAACNCSFRSLILSTPGTKEVIWTPHLMRRWPVQITKVAFGTLQDRLGLPTAAITTSPAGQNQPNIPLLLSMTPHILPTQVDVSLLNHGARSTQQATRRLMRAQESTSTHLQLFDANSNIVAYTGPIGSGDRCVRANHPLPRPTTIHGNRRWTGGRKSALLRRNSYRGAHPTPAPGVHSASGSLLSLLRHRARNTLGGMELCSPFCAPYYQHDGTLNVTPRMVAYFEVEILPKEKIGDEKADDDDVVVVPRTTTSECVAVGLATEAFHVHSRMPGWDSLSFGYHGDDGRTFHSGGGERFGSTFGAGDTVGCGIDYVTRGIFFTLNGRFLGYGWKNLAPELLNHDLYPVVGIDTNAPIQLNFGTCKPFVYNLDDFHASHEGIIQPRYCFSAPVISTTRTSCSGPFRRHQSRQKSVSCKSNTNSRFPRRQSMATHCK